jgi:DNA-binding CsgD family transcriptional regulator
VNSEFWSVAQQIMAKTERALIGPRLIFDENGNALRTEGDASLLRNTGISVARQLPWGAHLCIFYETPADLLAVCVDYFGAGLESNEFCVWAVSDPITVDDALSALRAGIRQFDQYFAAGQIEIFPGYEWYLEGDAFDAQKITSGWWAKLDDALARGLDGMRVSGNAFWIASNHWREFCEYEQELDRAFADRKMIATCTYPLGATRGTDILDVTRAHQCSFALRNGHWEFLETPELKEAKREIRKLNSILDFLLQPSPGRPRLTPRERTVLAHIVRGASSKEVARALNIALRTVEFHRANILRKLGARNTVELVQRVLDE